MDKKKALITISVIISLTSGSVLAAENASERLQQWYLYRESESIEAVDKEAKKSMETAAVRTKKLQEELLSASEKNLEEASKIEGQAFSNSISAYASEYIKKLSQKKESLADKAVKDFNNFTETKSSEIDEGLYDEAAKMLADLNDKLDKELKDANKKSE